MRLSMLSFLAGSLLIAQTASSWTLNQDFEDQVDGALCAAWSSTQSTVSSEAAFAGRKSCKQSIEQGQTGFGVWGGIIKLPAKLGKGSEFWVRVRSFMPSGFNYDSYAEGSHLKFMRLHTMSASVSNYGYNDWYLNPKSQAPFIHKFIYEGEQVWSEVKDTDAAPVLGKWETYEMYIRLDTVPQSKGGLAMVRMWKDGRLIGEFPERKTLAADDAYADRFHMLTYWNGGAPQTQYMFLDDIIMTSDTPAARDSFGNAYIGVDSAMPKQPTDLRVD